MENKTIIAGLAAALAIAIITSIGLWIAWHNQETRLRQANDDLQKQLQAQKEPAAQQPDDEGQGGVPAQNSGGADENNKPAQNPNSQIAPTPAPNTYNQPKTPSAAPAPAATNSGTRDARRISDMRRLLSAQEMWYGSHNRYYTCSISGGDCRGKANNYPVFISGFSNNITDPLNNGVGCGKDFTYCALDNTVETNKFCYYAKLEGGGYLTASHAGNFSRSTAPTTFDECAGAFPLGKPGSPNPPATTPQARDAQRQTDMKSLVPAQQLWYGANNRYYTCGPAGGDCKGANDNYPALIGFYLPKTPADPTNAGNACGRDYIYCGLDNTDSGQQFCYFAKLESGGYYTAAQTGNFKRRTPPATLAECGLPN